MTDTAYMRLLDALTKHGSTVRPHGDRRAVAQCPAHDDGRPSLSVADGDGQALLYCFAGCGTAEVLAALDMAARDLFDAPDGARYDYRDEWGEVLRTVHRTPDKRFRQSGDTRGTPTLYRLPEVVQAVRAGECVYLCEGEKDVHALGTLGVTATTAPQGAVNVSKVDARPLAGARVVAVVDRDAAGDEWAAQVRELLAGVAASVEFVAAATGKDAADHVAAGHAVADFQPYARPRPAILDRVRSGAWLDAQTFPSIRWAVDGLIPEGMGLFTGPPKVGKSWAALGIALAVAGGTPALGCIPTTPGGRPVLMMALEDGDRRMQGRARYLLGEGVAIPPRFEYVTTATPVEAFALMAAWLEENGDADPLVILDTLGKVKPPKGPGESEYDRDYRIGSQLKALTDRNPGTTLLVVHHVRKAEAGDWMDSTSGTNGLNGAADWTVNLSRSRNEDAGLLRVTGRDVVEAEYAVTTAEGRWTLDGGTLPEAALRAQEDRATEALGEVSTRIVEFVGRHPEGVTPAEVARELDVPEARRYLARLAEAGRVTKPKRGTYAPCPGVPTVPLSQSEGQGNGTQGQWGHNPTKGQTCPDHGTPLAPSGECGRCLSGVTADE